MRLRSRAHAHSGVNLAEGPVGGHLVSLGIFLALSVLSLLGVSLVDIYFVARLGAEPLAALSFTFPLVMILSAVSLGLGNGVVAVIARAVGEGDYDSTRALGTDSILLALSIVIIFSTTGLLTIRPLFTMLGAGPEILPLISRYLHVWYIGAAVQIIPQVGQSVLRAHGDTRTPGIISVGMSLTNMVLDPILIFGLGPLPAFGLQGAAIASIIARALSLVAVLGVLHYRLHALAPLSLAATRLRNSWSKLLHIGLPSMATQLVNPVSAAILTKIIALSGVLAIAAYGVGSRIEQLTSIYLWAVGGALPAFVEQNAGAGRMDRVQEAVSLATRFCIVAGLATIVVAMCAGGWVVTNFTADPQVQPLAVYYLRAVSLSYPVSGMILVGSQTMNALARPLPASMISLSRTVVVLVPFALIGRWLAQTHGVFIGVSLANATCGLSAWIILTVILAQEMRTHGIVSRGAPLAT